ncbi:SET and MYND domain protein [Ceratobasidium sp. AG-Ba]|nr:SET and MYND domain protein [Ceratobasidium sp. AG-Ba]
MLFQTCQKYDWPIHKFECPALVAHAERRVASTKPDDGEENGNIPDTLPIPSETSREKPGSGKRKEFELMQSHREDLAPSSPQTASYTRLGHALASYVSHGEPSPEKLGALGIASAKDIVDLLSKFSTNAHTLSTPSLTPIGVAISPIAALINHSCLPNCVIVFPKAHKLPNQLEVICIRPMNPGEELTTSYVDMALPAEHRQTILRERYMFECKCESCRLTVAKLDDYVDGRRALRCARRECEGFLPLPKLDDPELLTDEKKCLQCRTVCRIEPPAIADAIRIGEEGLEKAEALQFDDPERAFKLTSNLIPLLSKFFHVGAHPLLSLSRLHLALLISQLQENPQILDETIRAAARVAAGVSAIYPPGHPTRGVAYAELGKLLAADEYVPPGEKPVEATASELDPKANVVWVAGDDGHVPRGVERLRMAHHSLLTARKELLIGFGTINEGGVVGRMVSDLAKQLEREVTIWRRAGGGRRPDPGAAV